MRLVALITCLLVTCLARAQDTQASPAPPLDAPEQEAPCDPAEQSCGCDKNWGCFELVYMAKGAVLGVKVTTSYVRENGRHLAVASFVTTYSTERFATRDSLALHMAAHGTLGGGTAGTETGAGATLNFGWRGVVSKTSGPFLRAGMSGEWLSPGRLRLGLFEPLQGRVGYQFLEGEKVFEAGMTQGLIAIGSYQPGDSTRKLSEAIELGGYMIMQRVPFRVRANFFHVFPQANDSGNDVDLTRLAYCDYRLAVTLCADALYIRGEAESGTRRDRMTHALYTGITIGLSP